MKALEVTGLHTFYGKSHILDGVSLVVGEGRTGHFAGPQWRGQIHHIAQHHGLDARARGPCSDIRPRITTQSPPLPHARLGVGFVPEGRRIFANLTVEENLKVPVDRPGPWNIARVYELFPRLGQRKANKGRQLSGGEQEMLAIARALF